MYLSSSIIRKAGVLIESITSARLVIRESRCVKTRSILDKVAYFRYRIRDSINKEAREELRLDRRLIQAIKDRRDSETGAGTHVSHAALRMALVYPSPYRIAMSSLGYLQVHRLVNATAGFSCERAMVPDPTEFELYQNSKTPLLTIESQTSIREFDIIGISHSYELELTGIVNAFQLSGMAPLAKDRTATDPLVVLGGPITFSNPLPSSPFVDVVILGEAESSLPKLLSIVRQEPEAARGSKQARKKLLETLADLPGFFVPSLHGEYLPPIGQAADEELPAYSQIRTPNTELSDMMLIEPERGCHRGCTFCVMRRSTNGGMRVVSAEKMLSLVPDEVSRVGLVGAAVTDHPEIRQILRSLVDDRGKRIGISSLRADRLDKEFVQLLYRGGYRSITVALDAPSVRLRSMIEKNIRQKHIDNAVELARSVGMRHLKLYVIVGLPTETAEDRLELVDLALSISKRIPLVLGVSPFIPKFHTPMARSVFAGEKEVDGMLKQLKRDLKGRVDVRGPGAREAYVEYRLSQGGFSHAQAAIEAAKAGGSLGAWKKALKDLPQRVAPTNLSELVPLSSKAKKAQQGGLKVLDNSSAFFG